MNEVGFFLIDPRLNKEKMVESKSYFYSGDSKPLLSYVLSSSTIFYSVVSIALFVLTLPSVVLRPQTQELSLLEPNAETSAFSIRKRSATDARLRRIRWRRADLAPRLRSLD
jgi:hypothetical protein